MFLKKSRSLWLVIVLVGICGAAWGPIVSRVEQAKYTTIEQHGAIEIRDYAQMIVAETSVSGDRETAIKQGFRAIADYIFGNNTKKHEVAMTAPVTQQAASEKIAMTAPVTQSGQGKVWTVRFVMPSAYTMATLPQPNNDAVKLREVPGRRYAVIRFSGMAGKESLEKHLAELESFIAAHHLEALSGPTYAFFNPPWTLPFFRRNEVMVQVKG